MDRSFELREYWDQQASSFDDEPDHGLRSPIVRNAWTNLIRSKLPLPKGRIIDIGCGTGSLSIVIAELGFQVTGIDFSPAMIAQAKTKAAAHKQTIDFWVMDAAKPDFPNEQFDAILSRHLLWIMDDLSQVLERWVDLLKPGGYLFLVEGFWNTRSGLYSRELTAALPASISGVSIHDLSDTIELWGKEIDDERYLVTAKKQG